jgi:cysteine desulfurase
VQTYGKLPFEMDDLDVDSVAVSGHKFHGPRGAGFLALSSKAQIAPLQLAGGQEGGLRGGTENVAGAVGLLVAAEHALTHQAATATHTRHLGDLVQAELKRELGNVERLGHPDRALPHILSMRLPGIVGPTLLERCSDRGVAFSTGSACHSHGADDRAADNHVLAAIGFDRRTAREVVRLSFCRDTTEAETRTAARVLAEEALRLRGQAPRDFGSMEGSADQPDGAAR